MLVRPIIRPLVRPLVRGVTEPGYGALAGQIMALFAAGEEGAWYDPADMGSLYQDSAGTTPVTALGQPVGLMLDKSKGLVRGPELVTNGTFDSGVAGWAAGGGGALSAVSGGLRLASDADGFSWAYQDIPTVVGRAYEAKATVRGGSAMAGKLRVTSGGPEVGRHAFSGSGPAELSLVFVATDTVAQVQIYVDTPTAYTEFDNISVRELPGQHRSQTTSTARPVLAAGNVINFDGVDDYLRTVFPDLGADVTIARSIPVTGAQILTGQTIGAGNWDDSTDSHALVIVNRALTASETATLTRYLNQKAGV